MRGPAVFTAQIGHYHDARYRACTGRFNEFTVITISNEADFAELLATTKRNYTVKELFANRGQYRAALKNGEISRRVWKVLFELAPNVVAVAGWSTPESLAAITWARTNGRGVVIMSESQKGDGRRNAFRERIKSRVVRACDAALVGGSSHRDYLRGLGLPAERVSLGYDAVDNEHFSKGAVAARANALTLRRQHGLPDRYLLASARFIPKKNLPTLIAAYARATFERLDPPHLLLLGDGPERSAIEQAVAASDIAHRIHLPGFRTYDVLPIYYGLADGFLHVPLTEQWGLVINEAIATGLPVIASRTCGAVAELVSDGRNGFLVNPQRIGEIASAIARLLNLTPNERAEMSDAGRRIIADWGPERFATGLVAAANTAEDARRYRLAPWDVLLFNMVSRLHIDAVQ